MSEEMTSMQRVLKTLSHEEPDRVPLFLLLSCHGALELGMSIKEYFSSATNLVEGQLAMRKRYKGDCMIPFTCAASHMEAFGGDVFYFDDGPPNAAEPVIRCTEDIERLKQPSIKDSGLMQTELEAISLMKKAKGDEVPIIGTVIAPFSLPIMQMGFDKYIELIYENPACFNKLMEINKGFCAEWANAQLEAGATGILYIDPMSAPLLVEKQLYRKTGYPISLEMQNRINGMVALGLGTAAVTGILDETMKTGAKLLAVGYSDDIAEVKNKTEGRIALLGNINGIEACSWTKETAEQKVKEIIRKAGKGGGLIISDSSAEFPFQISRDTLTAISEAVEKWGKYPLDWIDENG